MHTNNTREKTEREKKIRKNKKKNEERLWKKKNSEKFCLFPSLHPLPPGFSFPLFTPLLGVIFLFGIVFVLSSPPLSLFEINALPAARAVLAAGRRACYRPASPHGLRHKLATKLLSSGAEGGVKGFQWEGTRWFPQVIEGILPASQACCHVCPSHRSNLGKDFHPLTSFATAPASLNADVFVRHSTLLWMPPSLYQHNRKCLMTCSETATEGWSAERENRIQGKGQGKSKARKGGKIQEKKNGEEKQGRKKKGVQTRKEEKGGNRKRGKNKLGRDEERGVR
jgi:hypothetical protein